MNTTNDELTKAKERLLRVRESNTEQITSLYGVEKWDEALNEMCNDEAMVVQDCIDQYRDRSIDSTTLAAREGEELLITDDWLIATGWRQVENSIGPNYHDDFVIGSYDQLRLTKTNGTDPVSTFMVDALDVDIHTRGQVLALLTALGIPAKEQQ